MKGWRISKAIQAASREFRVHRNHGELSALSKRVIEASRTPNPDAIAIVASRVGKVHTATSAHPISITFHDVLDMEKKKWAYEVEFRTERLEKRLVPSHISSFVSGAAFLFGAVSCAPAFPIYGGLAFSSITCAIALVGQRWERIEQLTEAVVTQSALEFIESKTK